jgi:hypothetical protein
VSAPVVRSPVRESVSVLAELRRRNELLFAVTIAHLALAALFTVLMYVDGRTLLGRNVWTKPWKFAISIAIFTATIGWILPSLSLTDRVEKLATYAISGAMTIEIALISTQAARGVASHFNSGTPLDTTIFAIMGVTITISSSVVAYVLWRVVRNPPDLAPAYLWGVGLGLFLFVVMSFQGWLMVFRQSHAVGAADGGPGLTLLNWSLTGGDLRVAHLIGLHALQVLPFTGYLVARWDHISTRVALAVVGVVGVLYSGLIAVTLVLALLGTPLVSAPIAPHLSPGAAAGVLLVLTGSGFVLGAAVWRRRLATQ